MVKSTLHGTVRGDGVRIALVVSRYHAFVTDRLRDAALAALATAGVDASAVTVLAVPGAFEIPQAARAIAMTGRVDAVVCLGCLIRGETPHFDYIAAAVAAGITDTALSTGVPLSFGVLTTNSVEEAQARAGGDETSKGWEAAMAAVEMATLFRTMHAVPREPRA